MTRHARLHPSTDRASATGAGQGPLSRRRFLQASAVGMAVIPTLAVRSAWAAPEEATGKVIVGAHPWVYAATQPNHDITPILDGIFADISYAGMAGIELMHTALRPDDAVERIGELSQKHKLPVIGTSYGAAMWDRRQHQAILEDADLVIGRLSQLGGQTLGTSVGHAGGIKTPEQLDSQAELLRKLLALCRRSGVVLNLHNHKYEVENNQHDLKGTLQRVPDIKLGPDLDWLVQADVDPASFLIEHGSRIVFLHLRDQKDDKTWVEAMGEGDMDYSAIGRVLRRIDFKGHAVIELAHPGGLKLTRPLRESLRLSRRYVRETLGY